MGSIAVEKPHAICIPYPAQGHITPMFNLAKLLHSMGFHITFVNTEYNHRRFLKSGGPSSLQGLPDFTFHSIPDGLPQPDDPDVTQDIPLLCQSTMTTCYVPLLTLIAKLNGPASDVPRVTCIISDTAMGWSIDAAELLELPVVLFFTASACGLLSMMHSKELIHRGLTPLKDMKFMNKEYLETEIDGLAGMEGIRFKDIPTFVRTADPNDIMLNHIIHVISKLKSASAIVLNTFDDLDRPVLDVLSRMIPPIYTVGPLPVLCKNISTLPMGSNLWKEDLGCLEWLDGKPANSVVYVNFGSITVMSSKELVEFAWGLANSKHNFLWVIRRDLVRGDSAVLPEEFVEGTKSRALMTSWCPQQEVLNHPAVGGFLTHCGWNSTLEGLCGGVPMLCWPFFAEQQTNCRYLCREWGVGMEIEGDVNRDQVELLIRVLMAGEKGVEMRTNALAWKEKAIAATLKDGSSSTNVERLVKEVLRA